MLPTDFIRTGSPFDDSHRTLRFSKNEVGKDVTEEIKEKITRLQKPRYSSYRPILIHVNGVSEEVEDSDYFAKVISFASFFKAVH